MKHWKIGNVTGLKADGLKAQEDLEGLLRKFTRLTEMQVNMVFLAMHAGDFVCVVVH